MGFVVLILAANEENKIAITKLNIKLNEIYSELNEVNDEFNAVMNHKQQIQSKRSNHTVATELENNAADDEYETDELADQLANGDIADIMTFKREYETKRVDYHYKKLLAQRLLSR